MFTRNLPRLPTALLRPMEAVSYATEYDMLSGGQYMPRAPTVTQFQGIVMPVSDKDLRYAPEGTYTELSQKLYTQDAELRVGAQVRDPLDGRAYTVHAELSHGPIHPMRRYIVEAKEASAPK